MRNKTSEKLPEHGFEVIGYSENWINKDFNPKGARICYYDDFGWHSAKWDSDRDCWDAVGKEEPVCMNCPDYKLCQKNSDPEYWIEIPKE